MLPVIIISGWHEAVRLMLEGFWSVRRSPGVFLSTPAAPRPGPVVLETGFRGMARLIRHGYECTHAARSWLCTPNQIGA
jgi:hypothetical protein